MGSLLSGNSIAFFFWVSLGAVWAAATNRRWVFLVTFSTAAFSITVTIVGGTTSLYSLFLSPLVAFLIFGLFVDIFLFQVSAAKTFYTRGLWSLVGGSILVVALLIYIFFDTLTGITAEVIVAGILTGLSFAVYLIVVSYIRTGFARIIRNIWPNIFEASSSSQYTKKI